ncbi:MAG TPA: molybdopterin-dependent oxidoreductase [Candidatus Nanoarchaeia archaeon]|nr:molybdopterin-dependent oxidoreductase [Candidatus Nanoarchaeia archaeon]
MPKKFFALIFVFIFLLTAGAGCSFIQPIKLDNVEIKDYNGEKLGSVNDFRENSIKGVQHVDISAYHLDVTGLVDAPQSFTYDQVKNLKNYQKVVTLFCVEGWNVKILWQGVLVRDLINQAKPKSSANTVIFYAADGYTTSFPLKYFYDNDIILAYKMNGATMPPERGFPFQLVAEDKWGYKWIKWVTKIELSDNPSYQGYWESRGYSNTGDLNKPY